MNDKTRDLIVQKSAYGFMGCVFLLLAVSIIYGKGMGRMVLFAIVPMYSLYYVVMYNLVCRGYDSEVKRISAFGTIGRGKFFGVIYYLSLFIVSVFLFLVLDVFYSLL